MRLWFVAFLVVMAATGRGLATPDPVVVVGEFSNIRVTDEHANGYSVQLWRQGNKTFGLFSVAEGLAGDTPTGILRDVYFEPRTGRLSFTARLALGVFYLPPGKYVPACTLYELHGVLEKSTITGTLKQVDLVHHKTVASGQSVRLGKEANDVMVHPTSYAEWQQWAQGLLARTTSC